MAKVMDLNEKMQLELLELAMKTGDKVSGMYERLIPYVNGSVHEYLIALIYKGDKKGYNAVNKAYRAGGEERERVHAPALEKYRLFNRSAMGLSRALKKMPDDIMVDYEVFLFITGLQVDQVKPETVKELTKEQTEKIAEVIKTNNVSKPEDIKKVVNEVKTTTPPTTAPTAKKKRATSTAVLTTEAIEKTVERAGLETMIKIVAKAARKAGKTTLADKLEELISLAAVTLNVSEQDIDDLINAWDDED